MLSPDATIPPYFFGEREEDKIDLEDEDSLRDDGTLIRSAKKATFEPNLLPRSDTVYFLRFAATRARWEDEACSRMFC